MFTYNLIMETSGAKSTARSAEMATFGPVKDTLGGAELQPNVDKP